MDHGSPISFDEGPQQATPRRSRPPRESDRSSDTFLHKIFFREKKRWAPWAGCLEVGARELDRSSNKFYFLISNNIKLDGPRQPNFFRRGTVVGRAKLRGVARSA